MEYGELSKEQQQFVNTALQGYNILVDACIGSGKTTAIQALCNVLPVNKKVLYLTYNKLLKLDAKNKIRNFNVRVQNYHGWAYGELIKRGIRAGISDILQTYNKSNVLVENLDVLILDEYQDIEQEIADMLVHIKSYNPSIQIIAVGDMAQKIYDKTSLNVEKFMSDFLGSCYKLEFTQCFRLDSTLASDLGEIWQKTIVGVNQDCRVSFMSPYDTLMYLLDCNPKDILCLGSNTGVRSWILNQLEEKYPEKFNKQTIWSKISDNDSGATQPDSNAGIFTTFDGCKGMERDICVVCDWTVDYWEVRLGKPMTKYEILRNIFCVAASRGKKHIIFCKKKKDVMLDKETLMYNSGENKNLQDMEMSKMFDFKFVEDVEAAYNTLSVKEVQPAGSIIDIPNFDGLIDLSPCIGIYQEAAYFKGSNIDNYINMYFAANPDSEGRKILGWESWGLESKVLYYTSLETNQNRYLYQVDPGFIPSESWAQIKSRLAERLQPDDMAQVKTELKFYNKGIFAFMASGFCDVLKDDIVYELKFVSELSHVHVLQLAMYLVSMDKSVGLLWNVRTNKILEVRVPDRQRFLDKVVKAATKGSICSYSDGQVKLPVESGKAVRGLSRPVSEPVNRRAFDYRNRTVEFVGRYRKYCYDLAIEYMTCVLLEQKFTGAKVERYFRELDVSMPMSGKTFIKYFGIAIQENWDIFSSDEQKHLVEFFKYCYPEIFEFYVDVLGVS